ncbi:MAG TPA: fluoride efflux transporter CrcB [Pyrinomonadaceae bacterium]|nr:fluoride efflux transporter CrcB [Pyrinomonadaceae bacterium]
MEALTKISAVAVGGAFGAVARYLINISPLTSFFQNFPLPTFVINITGSFLIGFLLVLLTDRFEVSEAIRMAVLIGFLGAFTTFSTFEMEIYGLSSEREYWLALLYLLLSVIGGFVAVVAGVRLAKLV